MKKLLRKLKNEKGQGMVEYGLIIALIAVVVTVALTNMGTNAQTIFDKINTTLQNIISNY